MTIEERRVAVLGAGTIGEALIAGLLSGGWREPGEIVATGRREERIAELREKLGVEATLSNADAVAGAALVVIAVKPQDFDDLLGEIAPVVTAEQTVLSIAAVKLGATRVAAVEIDHDSIDNAEENIRVNGAADSVEVIEGDATVILPLLAPVRVVLANIISSVLTVMLPAITAALAPAGQAIPSGLLIEERPTILDALSSAGWLVQREDREDVWWSVQIAPR